MTAPQPMSTLERNKQLAVRWFEEVWNRCNRAVIVELFSPQGVIHDGEQTIRGPEEFTRFYDRLHAQFANFHISPLQVLAEGDLACIHWLAVQKHIATGKMTRITGTSIVRIEDGKFVEAWQNWDAAGLAAQLSDNPPAPLF